MRVFVWFLLVAVLVTAGGEQYPGQYPGPHRPEVQAQIDDRSTWTASQHAWFLAHQFADHLAPAIALALAGAGGAAWQAKRRSSGGGGNA